MSIPNSPSRVIVILGMHRSGTSLVARYLHACGVSLGTDLLGKHESNPAGHFEDKAFLELHNSILAANHATPFPEKHIDWKIDETFLQKASALISTRSAQAVWGWKDPRTCLFLNLWMPLLPPDTTYVICIRPHREVIHSLLAREMILHKQRTSRWERWLKPAFDANALNGMALQYLRSWMIYNEELLKLAQSNPSKVLILPFGRLNTDVLHGMAMHLNIPPAGKFRSEESKVRYQVPLQFSLDSRIEEEATLLYQKLAGYA